jgi:NitT/TauT family transport system permease protein
MMLTTPLSSPRRGIRPRARQSAFLGAKARYVWLAIGVLLVLLVWEVAALAIGKELVLPSPGRVLGAALALYPTRNFLLDLGATFIRGLAAFTISSILGVAAGLASGLRPNFGAILAPLLAVIRATPVLALVLIALLWFPSGFVPVFSAFLMAFPIMVTSAEEGSRAVDPRLLEMALLFRVPRRELFVRLRLPSATPHLLAGAKSALGLCWKVVVAGEILSQPMRAIGSGMQDSRLMLESASVFAWALAAIFLCAITEWSFTLATKRVLRHGI